MTKSSNFDSLDYYKTLDVSSTASDEDIRKKYKELAKLWHPDHNTDPQAIDKFQKISVAYDVLKDAQTRLKYDILSMIYTQSSFPNMNALSLIRNMHGQEDLNLRAFHLLEVTGKGINHSLIDKIYYCNPSEALAVISSISRHNWLYGFWGISAFFVNLKAILQNISAINEKKENLTLFMHNALVLKDENKINEAATLATAAKSYASNTQQAYINKFLTSLPEYNLLALKRWNLFKLRRIQLIYPVLLLLVILVVLIGYFFGIHKEGNVQDQIKQVVVFNNGQKTYSDVAVAKIFDIPVDIYDKKRLYHFVKTTPARHGADMEFDVFKTVEQGTTVRITGYTADNKWLRIMFDNGEMAFVEADKLEQGIGNNIPLWSKIYKEE